MKLVTVFVIFLCLCPIVQAQEECGEWKYRWVKQECMRSLDLSDIETAVYQPPDTCWQQERYWVSKPCLPQEPRGGGYWLRTKGLLNIADFLLGLDSVWVPTPCPKKTEVEVKDDKTD